MEPSDEPVDPAEGQLHPQRRPFPAPRLGVRLGIQLGIELLVDIVGRVCQELRLAELVHQAGDAFKGEAAKAVKVVNHEVRDRPRPVHLRRHVIVLRRQAQILPGSIRQHGVGLPAPGL
jgi:hypothetical protein